ncbi:MAG: glutathione S-transferase family protein [Proteobacteria bacterium]|nr:glutathione S-transferase family protein [Pseudomonadota bacterium]
MKLYDGGKVPNARRVRMYLAEKGITVDTVPVDVGAKEHLSQAFLKKNPAGRVPVLELDDGTIITESVAICRYFEALHPTPALFGTTPLEQAMVVMWLRKAEFEFYLPVAYAFRHLHPAMADFEEQVSEWGEANRPRALAGMATLNARLSHVPYLAGDHFSIADIIAFITVDFLKPAKLAVPDAMTYLKDWYARVAARPSAGA